MARLSILFWRDIPAEVIVSEGRQKSRAELGARFAEAIDMAAMRVGARDSDAYLEGWRRSQPEGVDGDLAEIAGTTARELEIAYSPERLKALIGQGGLENAIEH